MGALRSCRRRPGRCALLFAALAAASLLCRRWQWLGGGDSFAVAQALKLPARAVRAALAAGGGTDSEDAVWREAYEVERQRNELLRDQLQSAGVKNLLLEPEAEPLVEPDECEIDWGQNYERLAACNRALEEQLRGKAVPAPAPASGAGSGPAVLKVPIAEQGVFEKIELSGFFGGAGVYYAVQARLPLGLELVKRESGSLLNAFVVEAIMPGGSADSSGEVMVGDVLQAVTVVMEGSDLGMKVEDFASSVVGGLGRYRQVLADTSFIDSIEDLVEAIQSNTMLSSEAQITLVFERNTADSPMPREPLKPVP